MNTTIKNVILGSFSVALASIGLASCSDQWDEHYHAEKVSTIQNYDGTTMQYLKENNPNFAKLVEAVGMKEELESSNEYTVFAPAISDDQTKSILESIEKNGRSQALKVYVQSHIARYNQSVNNVGRNVQLINKKMVFVGADSTLAFGSTNFKKGQINISCKNGVMHQLEGINEYDYNLYEIMEMQHENDVNKYGEVEHSLYKFLDKYNQDSLIENKSIARGVNEDGTPHYVYEYRERNNTELKNASALIYEEDSNYIAIIPSERAFNERYNEYAKLLQFNPSLNTEEGQTDITDSLTNLYANRFAMYDLFFNMNPTSNLHQEDSLKATVYSKRDWQTHCYYKPFTGEGVLGGMNESNTRQCGNGTAYFVDDYPMSIYDQAFYKKTYDVTAQLVNQTTENNTPVFWKDILVDNTKQKTTKVIGGNTYSFYEITPKNKNVDPSVGFDLSNTLSGTYDIYVVTCPTWMRSFESVEAAQEAVVQDSINKTLDSKYNYQYINTVDNPFMGYYLFATLYERNESNKYYEMGKKDPEFAYETPLITAADNVIIPVDTLATTYCDTTFLGTHDFKYAYEEGTTGVVLKIGSATKKSADRKIYSRNILVSRILLVPHKEVAEEAKTRKPNNR